MKVKIQTRPGRSVQVSANAAAAATATTKKVVGNVIKRLLISPDSSSFELSAVRKLSSVNSGLLKTVHQPELVAVVKVRDLSEVRHVERDLIRKLLDRQFLLVKDRE